MGSNNYFSRIIANVFPFWYIWMLQTNKLPKFVLLEEMIS